MPKFKSMSWKQSKACLFLHRYLRTRCFPENKSQCLIVRIELLFADTSQSTSYVWELVKAGIHLGGWDSRNSMVRNTLCERLCSLRWRKKQECDWRNHTSRTADFYLDKFGRQIYLNDETCREQQRKKKKKTKKKTRVWCVLVLILYKWGGTYCRANNQKYKKARLGKEKL